MGAAKSDGSSGRNGQVAADGASEEQMEEQKEERPSRRRSRKAANRKTATKANGNFNTWRKSQA